LNFDFAIGPSSRLKRLSTDPLWSGSKTHEDVLRRQREYYQFLNDYVSKIGVYRIVHTRGICLK